MGANPADSDPVTLQLSIIDRKVQLEIVGEEARNSLETIFSAMKVDIDGKRPDIRVRIRPDPPGFRISRTGGRSSRAQNLDDLVYRVEKIVTIGLQLARPELLFLHSAALARHGRAILLAGNTGGGKSTTTWGLLQHGFEYLTDELSAICLQTLEAYPYPHALCLKRPPPPPSALPGGTMDLGRTLHVPAKLLPVRACRDPLSIGSVFLMQHDPSATEPVVRSLSSAEAAARLYVTGLNVLAHPDGGLPAVLSIAERVPCFELRTADLERTCELVRATFDRLHPC